MMRYMDQLCFYSREDNSNRIYMLIKDGQWISEELPAEISRKFKYAGIEEPFFCSGWQKYIREGK
jgi:pilus assembly protein CpaF